MVLSAMPIGEYDRRVVLLTQERGKITVFVRGARKPYSSFGAATRPFAMGSFQLQPGRSAYTLRTAAITEYFDTIANDIVNAAYASYFLEFVSFYSHENMDGTQMLNLLYVSLRALLRGSVPPARIRLTFEIRAMAENGEFPDVFHCSGCRRELTAAARYLPHRGGIYCPDCAAAGGGRQRLDQGVAAGGGRQRPDQGAAADAEELSEAALAALRHIISAGLGGLHAYDLGAEAFAELEKTASKHKRRYISGSFKSLEVLAALLEEQA